MQVHDVVRRLRLELRLPELSLSAAGSCAFTVDTVTVTVHAHQASPSFTLRSMVCQQTDEDFVERAERLLGANLVTGPSFFAVDAAGAAYLTEFFQLPTLRFDAFLRALERFVDVVEHWQHEFQVEPAKGA